MENTDSLHLKSRFRGCLLGGLIGDCLGEPFQFTSKGRSSGANRLRLHDYFEKLDGPYFEAPHKTYTDDTAMTKSVAKSLIEKPEMDPKHMAQLFVEEFFEASRRGYGLYVVTVFRKLRNSNFTDIYKPAKEQFHGEGSYGNGGAMRIAPIALYFHRDYDLMITAARKCTGITHSNLLGIHGALLQCIAVRQCLLLNPDEDIDVMDFVTQLKNKMKPIEEKDYVDHVDTGDYPYQKKLNAMSNLLKKKHTEELDDEVVVTLGNGIEALHSVPTAIYCFLRSFSEITGIESNNVFRKTVEYAVSLGGDADTIGGMAGSLAGAYLGDERIGDSLKKHCEFHGGMVDLADSLYATLTNATKKDSLQQ